MAHIQNGSRITHHISLSPLEDSIVRHEADRAGMGICPYIRAQALNREVREVNWDVIRNHQAAIDGVAASVRAVAAKSNPHRWEYEADLEAIHTALAELLGMDAQILEALYKE